MARVTYLCFHPKEFDLTFKNMSITLTCVPKSFENTNNYTCQKSQT